ncbi:MAG: DJ-1/PfpI family protein [Anaerohalosphaeraceae bacterium]|nr:DJ-1/PfpI family protein [Anaerohalosphaeraceae bacterium]
MKTKSILLAILLAVAISTHSLARESSSIMNTIKLPPPDTIGQITLEQALNHRRSIREFKAEPIRLEQLSQLLWAAQGITDANSGYRTAPSAGAVYPINLYVALTDGLYSYNPQEHTLTKKIARDIKTMLYTASYRQETVKNAPCIIIIAGQPRKIEVKYRNKGLSLTTLEAGHIAQNILLQSVTIGLGSVPVGAFDPKTVKRICKFSESEKPLYFICTGTPAKALPQLPSAGINMQSPAAKNAAPKPLKAVIVVAPERFEDNELFDTQDILEVAGVEIDLASTKRQDVIGFRRNNVNIDLLVSEINIDEYDAFIFIGGIGVKRYFGDRGILNIVRQANEKGKVLAAIGTAPAILANANVVRGKDVTSYPSQRKNMTKAGGNWNSKAEVVIDDNIITANDYEAASRFARAILRSLRKTQN